MRQFPEVTIIDIDALLTQVREVMDKASVAVQYVFLFTLIAGVVVLLAAVQATRDERRYESAMLRTLGATRRIVFQGVAAEFTVLGVLAGLLASAAATLVGYLLARQVFDLKYSPGPAGLDRRDRRRCTARRRGRRARGALGRDASAHRHAASVSIRAYSWTGARRISRC